MILGVHNMVDAIARYSEEHLSGEGAWWILALNGVFLIPAIFAVFFYPMVVLVGVGAALILALGFALLVHMAQAHRRRLGHH